MITLGWDLVNHTGFRMYEASIVSYSAAFPLGKLEWLHMWSPDAIATWLHDPGFYGYQQREENYGRDRDRSKKG